MSTNHGPVISTCSEVKTPCILSVYEKFTFILSRIIRSMMLCLPLEIIAAPKGISQIKLQCDNTRTQRPAENCKSVSLLPPFALESCRKKIYFILLS